MLAQLVEDLVHLECGQDGFDEHRRPNRSLGNAQLVLRHHKDVVPETRLKVALQFWQVEVGAGAFLKQFADIVVKVETKVENAAGDWLAIDQYMLLVQVPAA